MGCGEPVHGEVTSADAQSGVEIVLYEHGTTNVRTLAATEYLDIHYAQCVTDTNLTAECFCGDTAGTPGDGERFIYGNFAANGGTASEMKVPFRGAQGAKPYVHASAAGNVYVVLQATIHKA